MPDSSTAINSGGYDRVTTSHGSFRIRETQNSGAMLDAVRNAKKTMSPNDRWRVDDTHSEADYDKDKKFISTGGSSFAISDDGDIISLAPNKEGDKGVTGSALLQYAVSKGGRKLDSFDGNFDFYVKNGFEPVSWTRFNEEYAPADWRKGKDRPENVVFFRYNPKGAEKWTDKRSDDFYRSVAESADYDTAKAKRNRAMRGKR